MKIPLATAAGMLATLLVAAPSAAAPAPHAGLYQLAGEIRGQIAEVQARANLVLPHCGDDAEDVREELAKLIRDLGRFEQQLARGIRHNNDLDRLARLARKVHDHADELQDELEDALEDLRFGKRRSSWRRANHAPPVPTGERTHYVGFDLDDLEDELEDRREAIEDYYEDLEDRFDDFDDDDFRRRRFVPRSPRVIYSSPARYYWSPWGARGRVVPPPVSSPRFYAPPVYQPRGVSVTVGRLGPSFSFRSGGAVVAPQPVLPPPPVASPVDWPVKQPLEGPVLKPVLPPPPGVGPQLQQVNELRASVARLYQLTHQLRLVLCG